MKNDETILLLKIVSLLSLVVHVMSKAIKKQMGRSELFEIDENAEWIFECMDEMIADLRQIHKQNDEQDKRLSRIEERLDNLGTHVDYNAERR